MSYGYDASRASLVHGVGVHCRAGDHNMCDSHCRDPVHAVGLQCPCCCSVGTVQVCAVRGCCMQRRAGARMTCVRCVPWAVLQAWCTALPEHPLPFNPPGTRSSPRPQTPRSDPRRPLPAHLRGARGSQGRQRRAQRPGGERRERAVSGGWRGGEKKRGRDPPHHPAASITCAGLHGCGGGGREGGMEPAGRDGGRREGGRDERRSCVICLSLLCALKATAARVPPRGVSLVSTVTPPRKAGKIRSRASRPLHTCRAPPAPLMAHVRKAKKLRFMAAGTGRISRAGMRQWGEPGWGTGRCSQCNGKREFARTERSVVITVLPAQFHAEPAEPSLTT